MVGALLGVEELEKFADEAPGAGGKAFSKLNASRNW